MDAVSVLLSSCPPLYCLLTEFVFAIPLIRVFTTSVADSLWALVGPAYVQLSQQFHVSVDEVTSSFAASLLGLAAFTYVALTFPIQCTRITPSK